MANKPTDGRKALPAPDDADAADRYVQAYPDLAIWRAAGGCADPLLHFLAAGETEQRRIPPALTPPLDWSDELYLSQHPIMGEVHRLGLVGSLLPHALATDPDAGLEAGCVSRAPALRDSLNLPASVMRQIAIAQAENLDQPVLRRFHAGQAFGRWSEHPVVEPALRWIEEEVPANAFDVAVVVHWLETGGAELEALWTYRAAESLGLRAAMVITDEPRVTDFFAGQRLNVLSLPDIVWACCEKTVHEVWLDRRTYILGELLLRMNPKVVHVCNSFTALHLLAQKPEPRFAALKRRTVISLYCPHYHKDGRITGYMPLLPRIMPQIDGITTDTRWYADVLSRDLALNARQVTPLRYPAPLSVVPAAGAPARGVRRVLWASRLDFQKNPLVIFEIAALLPEVQFDVWGRIVLKDIEIDWDGAPANVAYRGEFTDVAKLPLGDYDAFLYTALFDGLPNILLEMVAAELPIVSTAVGGIAELLGEGRGELVEDPLDPGPYAAALRRILADPAAARERARKTRAAVRFDHSFQRFTEALAEVPAYARALDSTLQPEDVAV